MYSLRMSFCTVPRELAEVGALLFGDGDIEREQDGGRGVDRHRGGDAVERDAVEEHAHVLEAGDGDADLADLALGQRVIGVVAHLRRQIEGDREAGRSLVEQVAVAVVGLFGGGEAGVLAHRPEPPAIHGRLDAAGVGILAGEAELLGGIPVGEILRRVERRDGNA